MITKKDESGLSELTSISPAHSQQQHKRHNLEDMVQKDSISGDAGLNELANVSPVYTPRDEESNPDCQLEHVIQQESNEHDRLPNSRAEESNQSSQSASAAKSRRTLLFTISYLIFFSLLGTLARLGLQALTFYPGAPVAFSEIWANLGGCIIMGFLAEDRQLFKNEWGTPKYDQAIQKAHQAADKSEYKVDLEAAKKAHSATKKTIPMFIGLSTGFCGCFTSFSSFARDAFLAMSNNLSDPDAAQALPRHAGYSVMAVLAVIIATVAICMAGLSFGAHLAIATESIMFSLPFVTTRKWVDPAVVFLAFGSWLGAVLLAIFPPHDTWRGQAVFALAFAPIGCLFRWYLARQLNTRSKSFPVGTFVANILGTAILGMSYDLQHVPLGGIIGCQALQGVEDGFCGCLTTVSTWVSELNTLRRRHAYRYGLISVAGSISLLVVIMGSMKWTVGFKEQLCMK